MWIEGGEETPLLFGHREERLGGDRPTNNKAELRAAILAAQFAQEVAEKMSRSIDVSIRGDSMYVVNGIIDGRLSTTTKEKSEQVNWEEWNDLRRAIREATKVNFFWKWVPRCLNRAADACANAVLDNTTINDGDWALAVPHAPPGLSIPDEKLLSYWSCTERTACKFLSPFMHDAWRKLFYALLQEAMTVDTAPAWFAVIAAPTIYLFPQPKAVQRVFLGRVSEVSEARRVFEETMSVPKVVERRQFAKRSTEESISYLVSGGKSARACELLEEKSVSVLPATKEDAERTWPNRSEGVLRFDDTTAMDINFAQVVAAARGMRNGRAADLGGWTKELFMVLLREASDFEKMQIEHFFMRIANRTFHRTINECLSSDKGIFIGDARKKRGVILSAFFTKVLWRMAFDRNGNHFRPQSIFGVTGVLQEKLASGHEVLKTDGSNAFFNISRRCVYDSIKHIDCPLLKAMWNLTYSGETTILATTVGGKALIHLMKTGVKAGCASGSKLFIKAMEYLTNQPGVAAIVDDIYFLREATTSREAIEAEVREQTAKTNINFFGTKTRWVAPGDEPVEVLGGILAPDPRLPIDKQLTTKIEPVYRLLEKLATIAVPLQVKFSMFKTLLQRIKFVFRATHLRQVTNFAESVDARVEDIFKRIFGVQDLPADRLALIHLPVEQGGLGIAHFQSLAKLYWNKQIDEGEIREENYAGFHSDMTEAAATTHGLKDIAGGIVTKSVLAIAKAPSAQLLNSIPRDALRLRDGPFEALIFAKLQYLPARFQPACEVPPGADLYAHCVECSRCRQGTIRHNAVNYELMRCIPKIGIVVSQNTSHLPLPQETPTGNRRLWSDKNVAGPDLIVYANPVHALDLTIVNPTIEQRHTAAPRTRDCVLRAVQKKKETYAEWEATYDMRCKPFVMTTNGFFGYDTQTLLSEYAKNRGGWFVPWVELRLQKTLCEAQANIWHMMSARKKAAPFTAEAASQR